MTSNPVTCEEDYDSVSSMETEEESLTIPISKDVYEILTRRESCLHDLIEKKFGCISLLKSIRCPLEVYRKSLKEGIEISVWMDDLTRHNADALVNAANEHLQHIGGLALALVKAGGPEIKQESKRYIERHGTLTTGQIAVTGGGRLSCKKIIHTVGPRWSVYQSQRCCQILEAAIINVLHYVNAPENNIRSVAIPAVSSGIFGFPLDLCAHVIVNTIKNFVELAPLFGWVKEIHLVNVAEPTVAAMKMACEKLLGRSDINALQETPPASANQLPDSIRINGLHLHIIRGQIEDQKTAIIVNSVVINDDLSKGNISRAILQKAGSSLQQEFLFELQKLPPSCEKFILTKGYNLACKSVLHVVWSSQNSSDSRKVLKTAMSRCLLKIQEYPFPSISFPVIGSGVLHLPKDEVADIMIDEVLSFAKEHPGRKLDVYFVIHPNNSFVYKAFQTKFDSAKSKLGEDVKCNKSDDLGSHSDRQMETENKKTGPAIELTGNRCEALEAAKIWIKNIMQVQESHLIVIENNHIFNLSKKDHAELSRLQRFGVSISEEVVGGKARLEIQGPPGAVIDAVFMIENLLCDVQENNRAKQEELLLSEGQLETDYPPERLRDKTRGTKMRYQISPVESYCQEFKDREKLFEKAGLRVLKIEKIHNPVLSAAFQRIKKCVEGKTVGKQICHRLYQRVPAQFCSLVCRAGFQRTYSPPLEQKYGAGIYFIKNPRNLVEDTKEKCELDHLICVFEAEVVTGLYTEGKQSYIVPPAVDADGMNVYDSVVDDVHRPETFVIFNSNQAVPHYILTCSQIWAEGSGPYWATRGPVDGSSSEPWDLGIPQDRGHRASPITKSTESFLLKPK
ncbi:protein mono-ADP-ribosyltransferase PARP9 isoform X2 [Chelonia mydas]|uniref:protein mono-ADP-ribosyltransferase PARP9 isoform X2 n=1 Tax=Chelonia mydas TaxID=8469 RepID=UPI0018A1D60B|nr:protein mono-ADP-ribosyltransferase PARP9 isoform X2 [Chelonia mydas]